MSTSAHAPGRVTDSHCHIQEDYLPDGLEVAALLGRAAAAGVGRAICIGTGERSSAQALALARASGQGALPVALWASVGLHPHDAKDPLGPVAALAVEAAPAPGAARPPGSLVAIGECGLDYFYDHSPRPAQQEVFAAQIALAARLALTLVVHTRDAWEDTATLLSEAPVLPERVVIHCFTGGPDEARPFLDLGAYLSFSGITTFKSAEPVREAARLCPRDKMLVETDAPFLAPVPHRGRPNEPALVTVVLAALAALRGEEFDALAEQTSANAAAAFGLPPLP